MREKHNSIKIKSIENLVYAKMCLECSKNCKIMILPNATLIKCPDFTEKKCSKWWSRQCTYPNLMI